MNAALDGSRQQPRALEHSDVFGCGGLRNVKWRTQLAGGLLSASQQLQHVPPDRIRQRVKHVVQRGTRIHNAKVIYQTERCQGGTVEEACVTTGLDYYYVRRIISRLVLPFT